MTSVFAVLRTSRQAWEATDSDQTRLEAAHGLARHLVRQLRQADSVVEISNADDANGKLTAQTTTGATLHWLRSGGQVLFGQGAASELFAQNITELKFTGYQADGVTPTTTPAEIRLVKLTVAVTLERQVGALQTVESWAWLRTW